MFPSLSLHLTIIGDHKEKKHVLLILNDNIEYLLYVKKSSWGVENSYWLNM